MSKAEYIRAPNDVGRTANDFGVLKFEVGTTHDANPVPREYVGAYVKLYADGGQVAYAFSTHSDAEVDAAVAATAAGATAKVGGVLPDNIEAKEHVQTPYVPEGTTLYFVAEASATTTVYMELSS